MRALLLESYDGPDALKLSDVPTPTADGDDVLVKVRAVGINFPDLLATQGTYQHKPPLPFVPGCEISGVVEQAPEGSPFSSGQRVAAFIWDGGYAEHALVPVSHLVPIPDEADFVTAAAMVVNYHTVYFGLARRAGVKPGETVLVLGAAGGIGSAAVQVAKGLGARVIGGVAGEAQQTTAIAAGADDTLVLEEGFSAKIKEMTDGRGVDIVVDPLGDWLFTEGVRSLAPEGRIAVIGFAAGDIPTLKVNRLLLRNVSAVGVAWGAFLGLDPNLMLDAGKALNAMYLDGRLKPPIGGRYQFEEIPDALHLLKRGAIPGKAVAEL
jgi:NADPH2:quinone reductase